MNDAFDELERQLREAVRTGAARNVRRAPRRMPLLAAAAAIVASGAALAATHLGGGPGAQAAGRRVAMRAARDTTRLPACRPVEPSSRLVLNDAAPLPGITAALPALAEPVSAGQQARALAMLPHAGSDRPILRRTARTVAFPGGVTLLVYVQEGSGSLTLRDAAACLRARHQRARRLAKGDVLGWALRQLAEFRDTAPGVQTLWVVADIAGQAGGGGSGNPVLPRGQLPTGLLSSGSAPHRHTIYVGIARRRTARIRVRTRHRVRLITPRQGFFALILPRHTGPVDLEQLNVHGKRLGTIRLRR